MSGRAERKRGQHEFWGARALRVGGGRAGRFSPFFRLCVGVEGRAVGRSNPPARSSRLSRPTHLKTLRALAFELLALTAGGGKGIAAAKKQAPLVTAANPTLPVFVDRIETVGTTRANELPCVRSGSCSASRSPLDVTRRLEAALADRPESGGAHAAHAE
ncbi:hypothetical protein HL653_13545 [Sphingomonas sp. AP4-R1]|uniref:hypothetical protein n=1 Tax=Sphingomonas sp. AP4-R1 TaxID=2735134 RepID=UPI001493D1A9|nr:hypothetical protein [Sphingomonas sp. AP4-R1]QJU58651.1 hypothetical protein HL653_13545 [Sphingomonas sp. AP4-R1]